MINTFRGNKWYKCDLHLHTPASDCFEDKTITPEEFINAVIKENIDCIAITDHNTVGWVDQIREVAKEKGIIVFPGVEITCSDSKVHLLILFDTDYKRVKIEDFLLKVGIDRELLGKQNAHSEKNIKEIAEISRSEGAIIIPAHIDDYSGIGLVSNEMRQRFLELDNINVVQMVNEELINNFEGSDIDNKIIEESLLSKYNNLSKDNIKQFIACDKQIKKMGKGIVTFSDNPNEENGTKHGIWGIGKRYSYIKMSEEPNLESLRQAFLFPQHRIKNFFSGKQRSIAMPQLWIKKINIKDIELLGKEELELEFNPQLTTIIGGRGSGKSTIIRFLTAVFNKKRIKELDEIYKEFISFYQFKNKDVGVLREETVITIEIVKNNILYKIILKDFKSGDKYNIIINKYDEDKCCEIHDIKPEDIFNIDVYNQKQIYELAKNTDSLRNKIDSLIDGINEKKVEANNLLIQYKKHYSNIIDIEKRIKNKNKIVLELNDIREKIDMYKSSGINDIIENYKLYETQRKLIKNQEKEIQDKCNMLDEFIFNLKLQLCRVDELEGHQDIIDIIDNKNLKYENIIKGISTIGKEIGDLKEEYKRQIEKSEWNKKYRKVEHEYKLKLSLLTNSNINPEEINKLLKSIENKERELLNIEKDEVELLNEYELLKKIKTEYIVKREEISELRQSYVDNLLADTNIKIKIKRFRNKDNFRFKLREIIQRKQSFDEDINKITDECFNGNIINKLEELVKRIMQIRNASENNSNYSARFNNLIRGLNNEQIAEISMFIPEDYIEIEYKPSGSKIYKSLKNASAGQRTSAILTFILSDGDTPLILDQPEDDLDNHLIYDLVVERLKICKEKRQIIVVTHNANIPVNGDAELIIAMDSNSQYIKVYKSGGIEDKCLRDEICNVMEGGETAFLMRANRYKI